MTDDYTMRLHQEVAVMVRVTKCNKTYDRAVTEAGLYLADKVNLDRLRESAEVFLKETDGDIGKHKRQAVKSLLEMCSTDNTETAASDFSTGIEATTLAHKNHAAKVAVREAA